MRAHAIEQHARVGEGAADFFRGLKELAALQHVIARLRARRAAAFCISEKVGERFCAVLRAFDGGVVAGHLGTC